MKYMEELNASGPVISTMRASLFGGFQLLAPDGKAIEISNRRARALLAMLCLAPDERLDREYVSKLLWPGRFGAQARASLRQCLFDLNKALGPHHAETLNISRNAIRIKKSHILTDLSELEDMLAQGQCDKASEFLLAIGARPILDQMDFGDEFRSWLSNSRQQVEGRLKVAVKHALSMFEQQGVSPAYTRLLDAWQVRNPDSPSPEIAKHSQGKTRIAVLPFRSLAEPDDGGFFADGISDELITTLGQLPEVLVAGRASSFYFKNSDQSLPEIAAALNVTHIVAGSVQRQDELVRINVSLIDTKTGFEMWSYGYDGSFDHIFTTRKAVGRAVNEGIAKALNLTDPSVRIRSLTDNREAYSLYLQGRALTIRAIGNGVLDKAVHLLEKALELDPEFAECWTALAEAQINIGVYTPCLDRSERCEKAAIYARKSLELSPTQGHARIVLAFYEWTKNNIIGAVDLAFEAYRLEPNNPDVVNRLGSFLLYCGRCKQALPYIEASIDQDPVNGRAYSMLTTVHLNLGNIDDSLAAGRRTVDLGFPSMWLARAIAATGNNALAVETYQLTKELMNTIIFPPAGTTPMSPQAMDAYWLMAGTALWGGDEEARKNYGQLLEMLHATLHDPYDSTVVFPAIWMGNAQMVFKTLGKQITLGNFFGLMSLWDDYEPTRQVRLHPDFLDFAEHIGLTTIWEKYGWPDLLPRPDNWSPNIISA
ncbi:MAG: hypothetical protein V7676_09345 [Parasphingorhabdus sp.]|uniref:tetratricopeptide repeat protein n=1 Tax=Parasphingorhabdus sp. TaxID=2709688 RepID=UPI003002C1F5